MGADVTKDKDLLALQVMRKVLEKIQMQALSPIDMTAHGPLGRALGGHG